MEKVFHYEKSELSVIKFKAKQVALLLGYLNPEDRISLEKLIGKGGGGVIRPPFSFELPRLHLNESGLYSLIFGSKLEFRVFTKGVPNWDTLLDPLKSNGKRHHGSNPNGPPLMNHKEA